MSRQAELAHCEVFHGRTKPQPHSFRYKIGYFIFDTRQSKEFAARLARKFHGTMSVLPAGYLNGDTEDFDTKIRTYLLKNCGYVAEGVRLMTLPRMFGYGFNPISFWLCYRNEKLEAALCEVNNTFGERHCYWITGELTASNWISAQKVFHVSPFFPVDGFYEFRFNDSNDRFQFDIRYKSDDGELRLATYLKGSLEPLESTSFTKFFTRYGWISFVVIARIHYQALRLWQKKATFFRKPRPPATALTTIRKDHP